MLSSWSSGIAAALEIARVCACLLPYIMHMVGVGVGVWGGDCDVADCYEFSEVSRSSSTTYLCHARRSPLSEHPA